MPDSILAEPIVVRIAGRDTTKVAAAAPEKDDASIVEVGSTGVPSVEPLVIATTKGQSTFYANAILKEEEDVAAAIDKPTCVISDANATVVHDDTSSLPIPTLDGFTDARSVRARCGWLRPASS
jgi:NADH-quinone oxidoreductase subunit F